MDTKIEKFWRLPESEEDIEEIVAEATRRGIEQGKREALKDVDDLMDIIAYEENHECQWEELRYRLSALSNLYKE